MNNNVYPSADFQARLFNRDIAWLSMDVRQMALTQDEFILLRRLFDNPVLHNLCDGLIISNETSIAHQIDLGSRIKFQLSSEPIIQNYNGVMTCEVFYFPKVIKKHFTGGTVHRLSL
jgi:hypothetical protein